MKAFRVLLAAVLICVFACANALAAEDVRPYMPRLGRYEMEGAPGDYVIVHKADMESIDLDVHWTGIYGMTHITAPFSDYYFYFTYRDGPYTITGSVFIDGMVLDLNLNYVAGEGDLGNVLLREGYFSTSYMYVSSSTAPDPYPDPYEDPDPSPYEDPDPVSGQYVNITGGRVNVRSGPGLSYRDIGTVHLGDVFQWYGEARVDERGVAWYNIPWQDGQGWVSSKYAYVR